MIINWQMWYFEVFNIIFIPINSTELLGSTRQLILFSSAHVKVAGLEMIVHHQFVTLHAWMMAYAPNQTIVNVQLASQESRSHNFFGFEPFVKIVVERWKGNFCQLSNSESLQCSYSSHVLKTFTNQFVQFKRARESGLECTTKIFESNDATVTYR